MIPAVSKLLELFLFVIAPTIDMLGAERMCEDEWLILSAISIAMILLQ